MKIVRFTATILLRSLADVQVPSFAQQFRSPPQPIVMTSCTLSKQLPSQSTSLVESDGQTGHFIHCCKIASSSVAKIKHSDKKQVK